MNPIAVKHFFFYSCRSIVAAFALQKIPSQPTRKLFIKLEAVRSSIHSRFALRLSGNFFALLSAPALAYKNFSRAEKHTCAKQHRQQSISGFQTFIQTRSRSRVCTHITAQQRRCSVTAAPTEKKQNEKADEEEAGSRGRIHADRRRDSSRDFHRYLPLSFFLARSRRISQERAKLASLPSASLSRDVLAPLFHIEGRCIPVEARNFRVAAREKCALLSLSARIHIHSLHAPTLLPHIPWPPERLSLRLDCLPSPPTPTLSSPSLANSLARKVPRAFCRFDVRLFPPSFPLSLSLSLASFLPPPRTCDFAKFRLSHARDGMRCNGFSLGIERRARGKGKRAEKNLKCSCREIFSQPRRC